VLSGGGARGAYQVGVLKAIAELTRELKRLDSEVHRVRREVQVSRRF